MNIAFAALAVSSRSLTKVFSLTPAEIRREYLYICGEALGHDSAPRASLQRASCLKRPPQQLWVSNHPPRGTYAVPCSVLQFKSLAQEVSRDFKSSLKLAAVDLTTRLPIFAFLLPHLQWQMRDRSRQTPKSQKSALQPSIPCKFLVAVSCSIFSTSN
jgi:hypothetical protein